MHSRRDKDTNGMDGHLQDFSPKSSQKNRRIPFMLTCEKGSTEKSGQFLAGIVKEVPFLLHLKANMWEVSLATLFFDFSFFFLA